ncbi:hypothetical protein [Antarcticirhabdus aurantiaca]|uniref:Uncharacterized protein n=1 Tax=Antarcticirhabdus aurantiaca TaxID=2606717 RepID=A0ACD4NKD2_9HYPH|nr:hypothetical protein [Antarcticirhabdus aurantiaca]WAJ27270.1 hypothetical protein OXU80_20810 [Jeongeuplla avenae]
MAQDMITSPTHGENDGGGAGGSRERVLSGYSLPTTDQLLHGFPFLCDDLGRDIRMFAATLLREVEDRDPANRLSDLRAACKAMITDEPLPAVRAAVDALKAADLSSWSMDARSGVFRCWIYAMHLGDSDPLIPLALVSVARAYSQDHGSQEDGGEILWQALAWLALYAGDIPELFPEPAAFASIEPPTERLRTVAATFRDRASASLRRAGVRAT